MENLSTYDDIAYAVKAVEKPGMIQTPEFRQWLENPEHQELYKQILVFREAFLNQNDPQKLNTESEWRKFEKQLRRGKISRSVRIYKWVGVAAAVAALIIGVTYIMKSSQTATPVTIFYVQEIPQEVTLRTNTGEMFLVAGEKNKELLQNAGVRLTDVSGSEGIDYSESEISRKEKIHTITTPRGKDFKIRLSDGTEVWLNAESQLRYPAAFSKEKRVVELEGEAYFKVARDPEHPFVVKNQYVTTQVLGTEFNFRAYSYQNAHVTLVSGSVAVSRSGHEEKAILSPGQDFSFATNGNYVLKQVDINEFIAWKEGYFYFENAELVEIMKELGRWYNLTVKFERPEVMYHHFNFWADRNDTAQKALELLNQVGKVKAELNDQVITISNID